MYRLFVDPHNIDLQSMTARLTGQDHLHLIRVLRCRVGDPITVLDGAGAAYLAALTVIGKSESQVAIGSEIDPPPEPATYIIVGQALGKSDKFEQVVQHGTEVGASEFLPIRADRGIVDIPPARLAERVARWRAIAKGAAEQSFRSRIPIVGCPQRLAEALTAAVGRNETPMLLHAGSSATSLSAALHVRPAAAGPVLLLVGPEGGWSEAELEFAADLGCPTVSLGPRVLRTETAALVAISQLLYHYSRPEEYPTCGS